VATDPMYRQIAEDLRSQIEAGELTRSAPLPTEIELREQYDASRNTVRDAIKWLINHDLVEARPGQGTFVKEKISPYVTSLTDPEGGSGMSDADSQAAADLRLSPGEGVVSRHQQRFIDGRPWSLQTSFYPMTLVNVGTDRLIKAANIDEDAVEYLPKLLGKRHVGWRDRLTVRAPCSRLTDRTPIR
jgi:GntR family transcriptional regulator